MAYFREATDLSYTQQAEIMLLAAEAGRLFVQECAEALNPAKTDWDGAAWADACHSLPWIDDLLPLQNQAAWLLYQGTLIAETQRLMDWPWRVFTGDETRQVDGHSGKLAQPAQWYAEPKGYEGDVLYSPAFPTRAQAEAWADRQPADDDESEDD